MDPSPCLDDGTIATFVAGRLDPSSLRQVEEHLAGCAVCRSAAAAGLSYASEPEASPNDPASSSALIADRFELRELIAQGGMGVVYHGHDRVTGKQVAIKVMRPALLADQPEMLERFIREGEVLRRLDHPNIVKMIAAVHQAGQQYIVLEYVAGGSLRDLLRSRGTLDAARAVEILLELADALGRAHHLGSLHRDVKPENVLIASDGTPKLTDFGLALSGEQRLTQDNTLLGTLVYLSPEALSSERLDARADVWACGVVAFEMLAGRVPFPGATPAAVVNAILHRDPPDLGALRPDAPPALIALVTRMLAKARDERVASARQVAAELEVIAKHLGSEHRPSAEPPATAPEAPLAVAAPRGREPIYGRRDVLAAVQRSRECTLPGAGKLVLFTGEAGIGKSFLVQHLVADSIATGARVAWGRCWEAGGAPAYWPWQQIFRDLGLENPFGAMAPELVGGALEARFAAFEHAARQLGSKTLERPLTLVLDDLHVADAPSLLFLVFLARELHRLPLFVLGAYRAGEAAAIPTVAPLLAQLARDAEIHALARLELADVAAWLRSAHPEPTSRMADELFRLTEGHPLLVSEVLRSSRDPLAGASWLRPRAVLAERLARLSVPTRRVLEVGAIWGCEFVAADVAAAGQLAPDSVFLALREARAVDIVEPPREGTIFRFSHVLLRDELYAELPPSTRASAHLAIGRLLAARGDPRAALHHLFEGFTMAPASERADLGCSIAPVAIAAAQTALAHWAFEEASRLGRRALLLFTGLPERVSCELELLVAEALIRQGEVSEGKGLCDRASERALRIEATDLFARAALVHATELSMGHIDAGMVSRLRSSLARLDPLDSPLRARLLARLATALTPARSLQHGDEAVALLRAAAEMARRLDDRPALLYVLQFGMYVGSYLPEGERLELARESLDLARELKQPLATIRILPSFLTILAARGEQARFNAELEKYDDMLASFPQPAHRLRRLVVESLSATLRGDIERSQVANAAAHALAERTGTFDVWHQWVGHQLSRAQLLGRVDTLLADLDIVMAVCNQTNEPGILAWVLTAAGRPDEAVGHLRRVPEAHPWSFGLVTGAEACLALGPRLDSGLATDIYALLAGAGNQRLFAGAPGLVFGPTGRALGDLALALGRRAEALQHYDEALAFTRRLQFPLLAESCERAREAAQARPG